MNQFQLSNLLIICASLILLLLIPLVSFSQDVILETQAQVDAFDPSTTIVTGNLFLGSEIQTSDITDITNLSNLSIVEGDFLISRNSNLISLNKLSNLSTVNGTLKIYANPIYNINSFSKLLTVGNDLILDGNAIASLEGLSNLEVVGGDFRIDSHINLTNIENLNSLRIIGGEFWVGGNKTLVSITGLESLDSLGGLEIRKHDKLQFVNMMNNLTAIEGSITFAYNDVLREIKGFDKLSLAKDKLGVWGNDKLNTLQGFSNIDSVYSNFRIIDNDSLINMNGFLNLRYVGGNLEIEENDGLLNLEGMEMLNMINGNCLIIENASLPNLIGLISLDSIKGNLSIINNASLLNQQGLPSLKYVGAGFNISQNNALVNIVEMPNLSLIGGNFTISSNPSLITIKNQPILTSAGGLTIFANSLIEELDGLININTIQNDLFLSTNDRLKDVDGLTNITSVGGGIEITENHMLTNVDGFSNINYVGGRINFYYNKELSSINGFKNLTIISKSLIIRNNHSLIDLKGFSKLTTIGIDLSIYFNIELTQLNTFSNLTSIGSKLIVSNNFNITNLDGFYLLNHIGGDFSVNYNKILTDCCGIKHLLDDPSKIIGNTLIYENPSECSSVNDILEVDCGLEFTVITNPPCQNIDNGSFQLDVNYYSSTPFHYSWEKLDNGLIGQGVSNNDVFLIEGLETGTYNITVSTSTPDTAIRLEVFLPELSGTVFEIREIESTNSSNGQSNGSLNIIVSGGTPPFSISWSGQAIGNQSGLVDPNIEIPFLTQGEYSIIVQDDLGFQQEVAVMLLDETYPVFECEQPLDIVILNDVSGSVDAIEYEESKEFFIQLLRELNLGNSEDESRASIIEWSNQDQQKLIIPFTGEIATLEEYLNYSRSFTGGTSPHEALEFGYDYLSNNSRPVVEKVLILSTDGTLGQISPSLILLCDTYKAKGYHIVTIAFDGAFSHTGTRNFLRQMASIDQLAPGAPAYSDLDENIASNIVHIFLCPIDPGSSATTYFSRDGAIDILEIVPTDNCPFPEYIDITFTVEAKRELSIPASTPITFYYNDPMLFGATSILTWLIPCGIAAGETETYTVRLPNLGPSQIYAVLNDNGVLSPPIHFPITDLEELAYSNNIDHESVCLGDLATLQAIKYTDTPIPSCDTIVSYTINVCNVSAVDAFDVTVEDQAPIGFSLINTIINDNGCGDYQDGTFDIPAECCVTITLTYDASDAALAYYGDQDVILTGPDNQTYLNFQGEDSSSEDLTLDGNIDCPSTIIEFFKEVNVDQSCDDAFLVYTFTINNEMNIPLYGLSFSDILPEPCEWVYQPYNFIGLSVGEFDINANEINITIDKVEPNTSASFSIDASLGRWTEDGELMNIAELNNVPDALSNDLISLTSNSTTTEIQASPELIIPDTLIVIKYSDTVDLEVIFSGDASITWTTSGDGQFTEQNNPKTKYILGSEDVTGEMVLVYVSASTECNEYGQYVVILFEECLLFVNDIAIGDCDDNETSTDPSDDTFEVTLNVSAQNPGSDDKYFIIQANDTIGSFSYSTDQMITLPADGNTYQLVIEDTVYDFCNLSEEVSQESCSNECQIEIVDLNIGDCDDNGTPLDSLDDTFKITFEVTALNSGFDEQYFVINSNDTLGRFDYNIEQEITLPADGNSYLLIFQDTEFETCRIEEMVIQESCSNDCQIEIVKFTVGDCNDNGTPSDNTDDIFNVTFEVSAINSGPNEQYYIFNANDTLGSFQYDNEYEISLPADGIDHTLIIVDTEYGNCKIAEIVTQASCSNECQLHLIEISSGECDDNATPTDPTDDTYQISFNVSAQNAGDLGMYYVMIASDTLGIFEYDINNKAELPADGIEYTVIFIDVNKEECIYEEKLVRDHCSTKCQLSLVELIVGDCFNNNTPSEPSDDIYEITINVSATDQDTEGSLYAIYRNDTLGKFNYNVEQQFSLVADGFLDTISLFDIDTEECNLQFTVNQTSCSLEEEEEVIPDLVIPNVFSPNGDNINDSWEVFVFNEDIQILRCLIFDRWGNMVYLSDNEKPLWNGVYNNKMLNDGVYVYQLTYKDGFAQEKIKVGNITLIK